VATLSEILDKMQEAVSITQAVSSQSYSTAKPTDHALAVESLVDRGIPRSVAGDLANQLADRYREVQKSWPTVFELLSDQQAINQITHVYGGLYALPPAFGVQEENGSVNWYRNSPLSGVQPIGPGNDDFGFGLKALAAGDHQLPVFDRDEVSSILSSAGFGPDPGGGGGGGGGAAPKPPAWDRDQLIEGASRLWRGMLLTEPGADLERYVDEYVTKATSFLMDEGGRLDFETFILGKIRQTPRYKVLYQAKAPGVSEEAHLSQYVSAVRQLGFPDRSLDKYVTQGAASGASVQGFTERLTKTGDFMAANQGSFSQKFGNMVAQLGIRGT
jgi:hypothetical protein